MKDLKSVIEEYKKIDFTARKAALATVVRVRGSSYRSPGARMLITDDGKWVGSISGGCLEGDALRKARSVMADKKPVTVTYDTSEEGNTNLAIGLGCNGIIDVLIEPLDPADNQNPVTLFETLVHTTSPVALATVFSETWCGQKQLIDAKGNLLKSFADARLDMVTRDLHDLFEIKKSETKKYLVDGAEVDVFVELIQPSISLIIFGGGFDARPVSQLARTLGWDVTVTDECVAHIAPVFFPDAVSLSLCQREFVDREFEITPYTACILMSHNYDYDRDVLRKIVGSPAPYIGILGPRKRFEKMVAEFGESGFEITLEDFDRIHSPIGLDIGAEAPGEIAVSIIAEIQTRFANRPGGFLKNIDGPIHERTEEGGQVLKQVYL